MSVDIVRSSPRTTIVGNALATLVYLQTVGIKLPSNRDEWIQFAIAALIAILSLLMKDERGTTRSP